MALSSSSSRQKSHPEWTTLICRGPDTPDLDRNCPIHFKARGLRKPLRECYCVALRLNLSTSRPRPKPTSAVAFKPFLSSSPILTGPSRALGTPGTHGPAPEPEACIHNCGSLCAWRPGHKRLETSRHRHETTTHHHALPYTRLCS